MGMIIQLPGFLLGIKKHKALNFNLYCYSILCVFVAKIKSLFQLTAAK